MSKLERKLRRRIGGSPWVRRTSYLLAALAIGWLYSRPARLSPLLAQFPAIASTEGAFYALRLKAALQGDPVLSCVQDPSVGTADTFIPYKMETTWSQWVAMASGADPLEAYRWTMFLLPALLFGLFLWLIQAVIHRRWLSPFLAAWVMLEPALGYWKPIFFDQRAVLPFYGYAEPLLWSVPMIFSLGWFFLALERMRFWRFIALAFSVWALVYTTPVYYWGLTLAGITLFLVFTRLGPGFRGGALSYWFALAPALILLGLRIKQAALLSDDPELMEAVQRSGFLGADSAREFLFHKGFWVTFVVYQVLCFKRWDWRWRFLTAVSLAGWGAALYFGHRMVPPMTVVSILVFAESARRVVDIFARAGWPWLVRYASPALLCLFMARGLLSAEAMTREMRRPGMPAVLNQKYSRTIAQLRALPRSAGAGSILADPKLAYPILWSADLPVFVLEHTHRCLLSDYELFARWAILWKVRGLTTEQVREELERGVEVYRSTGAWYFGSPESFSGAYVARKGKSADPARELATVALDAYSRGSFHSFVRDAREGHGLPVWLLESPGFNVQVAEVQRVFRMEKVAEVPEEGTRLWRLKRL